MKFKYFSLIPLVPFLRLDIVSNLGDDFISWINTIMNDLITVFDIFVMNLSNLFMSALNSAVFGLLGFVGVPFTSWSQYVAQNGGWFIPIIFVAILGIAFLIAEAINVAYGFEKDISSGESDLSSEEQHVAEEEAE